ncbi:Ig-like domain-containing protein [Marinicella sp. W31]|uniref:Ig-like domain-containing protein n=1 Tax=Marinicella sp. W31 TaxID=3023713 RepID=UPI0037575F7A
MRHAFISLFCLTIALGITNSTVAQHGHKEHERHLAMRALINPQDITHTAINNGSWFASQTWQNGQIPSTDAYVMIPQGISITYDQISQTPLRGVRVEGELRFSTSSSSLMRVDILYVDDTGMLMLGSKNTPIDGNVTATINIIDYGDLDTARDGQLLGRGILALGPVIIHGERKTTHGKVAIDPRLGDTQITMDSAPLNWKVGDTLVIAGTKYSGWKWDNSITAVRYHGTQDEIRTITAINNNVISFSQPLEYDHITPRADLKTSVANYSRSITIATENPDTTPRHRRGHVMFMHHANVDVRYASFWQLGRTDKSVASFEAADIVNMQPDSNVRGRYSFHFHRAGVEQPRAPGIAVGNAVFGSPGWGYVHHDSNAVFHNNVSYDTFGAGFVAETGNEIGSWTDNLAIKAEGNSAFNPKNGNDRETFDIGRTGDGFWFQGRMVRSVNNTAASVNHGFVYLHRGSGMLSFDPAIFMLPDALRRDRNSAPDDAPILSFHGNESFASTVGLYVVKANPNQQHDIHSHLEDFKAWEVRAGAALEYTSHYLLKDFDIIGKTPEAFSTAFFGIEFGTNTSDMVINNANIANMQTGVRLQKNFTGTVPPEANQYVLIDVSFDDVTESFEDYDPNLDILMQSADLVNDRFNIAIDNSNPYEYNSPATSAGSGVDYVGSKTDSIGSTLIPGGTDDIGTPSFDMIGICEQDGYYQTSGGETYAIVKEYFTERATGTIHKFGFKTRFGQAVVDILGNQFHAWGDCFLAGTIDLNSQPPIGNTDIGLTAMDTEVTLDLLSNDTDPDNDTLSIDGIVQPLHGTVFDNGDGSVLYRPDFDYIGTDRFSYWVTDNQGHFTPTSVIVNITPNGNDLIFANGFD